MVSLNSFKTDVEKASKGIWKTFEGGEFLIARVNNPEYMKEVRVLSRNTIKESRAKTLSNDELAKIQNIALAKYVLLDWKNIEDAEGNPLVYTWELGLEIFTNPEYSDISDFVILIANSNELYRKEVLKDSVKN